MNVRSVCYYFVEQTINHSKYHSEVKSIAVPENTTSLGVNNHV